MEGAVAQHFHLNVFFPFDSPLKSIAVHLYGPSQQDLLLLIVILLYSSSFRGVVLSHLVKSSFLGSSSTTSL